MEGSWVGKPVLHKRGGRGNAGGKGPKRAGGLGMKVNQMSGYGKQPKQKLVI